MRFVSLAVVAVALAAPLAAQETHYEVRLDALELTSGTLPSYGANPPWQSWSEMPFMTPYAVLDGAGEALYRPAEPAGSGWQRNWPSTNGSLCLRAPEPGEVSGKLFVPEADLAGMRELRFRIPAEAASPAARAGFIEARAQRYDGYLLRGLPGSAWFRHQRGAGPVDPPQRPQTADDDLLRTYALFSGGRAVSENLQLERALPSSTGGEDVALAEIEGISTPAFDWTDRLEAGEIELDPLAAWVPADQHALFFPSFADMVRSADEAAEHGGPLLELFEARSTDAGTRGRTEAQLGLPLDAAARTLGPLAVASVAITGSDPYLRTGSDVAVLLEPRQRETLALFLEARRAATLDADVDGLETVEGEVEGVAYRGVVSPDRRISSYMAAVGEAFVVTNSLHQLGRIARVHAKREESLAALDEYRFFRQRYVRDGQETAFLMLSDATIRRWCGPRWRIASARRVQAAALLAELQAQHHAAVLDVDGDPPALPSAHASLGELTWTEAGVHSSRYGNLAFLTPIAELDLERVGKEEARLYGLWRRGYERNWSTFFDPIALRLHLTDDALALDLSVMPLIVGSDYRDFSEVTGDARLAPDAGDPHAGTVLHFAMAIDTESGLLKDVNDEVSGFMSEAGVDLFDWLGGALALYVDESPLWSDLAEAEDPEHAMELMWDDLEEVPVVLHVDVTSGLKLAAFLVAVRSLADQTAPGAARWETREHGEERYVRISSDMVEDDFALYYATPPGSFVLTVSEKAILAVLDRAAASSSADEPAAAPAPEPWLGESVALKVERPAIDLFGRLGGDSLRRAWRHASWSNLPILNEWKRLHPDADPAAVHAALWHEELVCPGGGRYVWNEAWSTMESTLYGHPGEPRDGAALPGPYGALSALNLGLTLEPDGLRARAHVLR